MKKFVLLLCDKKFSVIDAIAMGILGAVPAVTHFDFVETLLWIFPIAFIITLIVLVIQNLIVTYCNK